MSTEQTTSVPDAPDCTACDHEMRFVTRGVEQSIPMIGTMIEYVRFRCPECDRATRFERDGGSDRWRRHSVPASAS